MANKIANIAPNNLSQHNSKSKPQANMIKNIKNLFARYIFKCLKALLTIPPRTSIYSLKNRPELPKARFSFNVLAKNSSYESDFRGFISIRRFLLLSSTTVLLLNGP